MGVVHAFVSEKADGVDTTLIQPSNWNAGHVVAVATADINDGAVTLAKMADVAAGSVFYRATAGTGAPEVQTLATLKTALGLTGTNSGDQTSVSGNAGTATALQTSRDFSITGGGITAAAVGFTGAANVVLSASVDAGHITLARMADVATATVFYRKTAGTGAPEVQTLATLKTDLGLTGTNSGDQTSIVGITGTLAQFDTACTDANFLSVAAAAAAYQPLDTQLTDLAGLSYSGNGSKYVRVNAAANGFEVVTLAGGGDLVSTNNLSDVASVPTARNNLLGRSSLVLAADESVTSTTPALIADANGNWTIPVVSGTRYRIMMFGKYSTAAGTTGCILNMTAVSSAAGTLAGRASGAVVNTAASSELSIQTIALPWSLTTTGMTAAGTSFVGFDLVFVCTASGNLEIRWGTEVNASAAVLVAGSVLIWEQW